MDNQSNIQIGYRWLGAAGIELRAGDQSLLIDPYVTRIPWRHMLFHHVQSNRQWVKELFTVGDFILVSHAHIDHLLDTSTVMEQTGASVFGSQNTCRLLRALGTPETKIHPIEAGDHISLGAFQVSVYPAKHMPVPGFMPGIVPVNTKPPRTARQFRMDACYSFLIEAGGIRILAESGKRQPHNMPADVLIIHPFYSAKRYQRLLTEVQPKLVIPNHWDNFMPTFSRETTHDLYPKDWVSSVVRRIVLPRFSKMIQRYNPDVEVLIPQLFHKNALNALIKH